MATDHHHPASSHGDDGIGPLNHETTDIALDGVGKLTIGFVLIIVIVSAAMYGTYRLLDNRARAADTPISKMNEGRPAVDIASQPLMDRPNELENRGRPMAGPKLLTNERLWLSQYRAGQLAATTTYGWVDKDAGVVRLPIERAKLLLVERGLPATAAPAAPATQAEGTAAGTAPTVGPTAPTTGPPAH
jgi:hypothetical protein